MFRDVSRQLPELWPTLTNSQKKELLRTLIGQVIIRRPAPDQIEVRIVWLSGCYTDYTTLTPIHRQQDASNYDALVVRIHQLWQQGYSDEAMAQRPTDEGFQFRPVRLVRLNIRVMKIRSLQVSGTISPDARIEEVDGCLTSRGLAVRLGVNESTVCRFIAAQVIPAERVRREPRSGIYLIDNNPGLIDQLGGAYPNIRAAKARSTRANFNKRPIKAEILVPNANEKLPYAAEELSAPAPAADKAAKHTCCSLQQAAPRWDRSLGSDLSGGVGMWFNWLDSATQFRYHTGQKMTVAHHHSRSMRPISVRKEKRRQGFFWCAYLRTHGQLYKRYVGRSQALTVAKLDEVAVALNYAW